TILLALVLGNQWIQSPTASAWYKASFVLLTLIGIGLGSLGILRLIRAWKNRELNLFERLFQSLNFFLWIALGLGIYFI
ncbi:MAG: hypothetical protein AAFU64_19150, partial [Bacteroidota bacterium]